MKTNINRNSLDDSSNRNPYTDQGELRKTVTTTQRKFGILPGQPGYQGPNQTSQGNDQNGYPDRNGRFGGPSGNGKSGASPGDDEFTTITTTQSKFGILPGQPGYQGPNQTSQGNDQNGYPDRNGRFGGPSGNGKSGASPGDDEFTTITTTQRKFGILPGQPGYQGPNQTSQGNDQNGYPDRNGRFGGPSGNGKSGASPGDDEFTTITTTQSKFGILPGQPGYQGPNQTSQGNDQNGYPDRNGRFGGPSGNGKSGASPGDDEFTTITTTQRKFGILPGQPGYQGPNQTSQGNDQNGYPDRNGRFGGPSGNGKSGASPGDDEFTTITTTQSKFGILPGQPGYQGPNQTSQGNDQNGYPDRNGRFGGPSGNGKSGAQSQYDAYGNLIKPSNGRNGHPDDHFNDSSTNQHDLSNARNPDFDGYRAGGHDLPNRQETSTTTVRRVGFLPIPQASHEVTSVPTDHDDPEGSEPVGHDPITFGDFPREKPSRSRTGSRPPVRAPLQAQPSPDSQPDSVTTSSAVRRIGFRPDEPGVHNGNPFEALNHGDPRYSNQNSLGGPNQGGAGNDLGKSTDFVAFTKNFSSENEQNLLNMVNDKVYKEHLRISDLPRSSWTPELNSKKISQDLFNKIVAVDKERQNVPPFPKDSIFDILLNNFRNTHPNAPQPNIYEHLHQLHRSHQGPGHDLMQQELIERSILQIRKEQADKLAQEREAMMKAIKDIEMQMRQQHEASTKEQRDDLNMREARLKALEDKLMQNLQEGDRERMAALMKDRLREAEAEQAKENLLKSKGDPAQNTHTEVTTRKIIAYGSNGANPITNSGRSNTPLKPKVYVGENSKEVSDESKDVFVRTSDGRIGRVVSTREYNNRSQSPIVQTRTHESRSLYSNTRVESGCSHPHTPGIYSGGCGHVCHCSCGHTDSISGHPIPYAAPLGASVGHMCSSCSRYCDKCGSILAAKVLSSFAAGYQSVPGDSLGRKTYITEGSSVGASQKYARLAHPGETYDGLRKSGTQGTYTLPANGLSAAHAIALTAQGVSRGVSPQPAGYSSVSGNLKILNQPQVLSNTPLTIRSNTPPPALGKPLTSSGLSSSQIAGLGGGLPVATKIGGPNYPSMATSSNTRIEAISFSSNQITSNVAFQNSQLKSVSPGPARTAESGTSIADILKKANQAFSSVRPGLSNTSGSFTAASRKF
jgi:hypothetical protein